jgi:hypothetical protein
MHQRPGEGDQLEPERIQNFWHSLAYSRRPELCGQTRVKASRSSFQAIRASPSCLALFRMSEIIGGSSNRDAVKVAQRQEVVIPGQDEIRLAVQSDF